MPWAMKRFGSWDSYTGPVKQVPLPGKETEAEHRKQLPRVTSGSRVPFSSSTVCPSQLRLLLLFPPERLQCLHHGSEPSVGKGGR